MSYWEKRLGQIADKEYNHSDKLSNDLYKAYKAALNQIEIDIADLYIRMAQDGEISALTLYKYDRYTKLYDSIALQISELGKQEQKLMQLGLLECYKNTYQETADLLSLNVSILPTNQIEKAVAQNWQGRNFSTSIWRNKQKLLKQLDKMVVDSIVLGKSKDEAIKAVMKAMGTGFSDTDRLVRTETMFIINQSQKDVYIAANYTKYKILAATDARTSKICREQNNQEYYLMDSNVGVNFPPFHPRCRTTIIPILDSLD